MRTLLACFVIAICIASAVARPGSRTRRGVVPARTMMFTGYFRGHPYPHAGGGFRHYVPRSYEPEGAMTAFAAGNTVHAAGSYYGNGAPAPTDCSQCNGNGYAGNGGGVPVPPSEEPAPEVIPVNGEVPEELPAADEPAYPADDPEAGPAPEDPVPAPVPEEEPEDAPAPPAPTPAPTNGNGNGKRNGNGKKNGNSNGNGNGNGGKTRPRVDDEEDYSNEEEDFPLPGKRGRGRGNFYNTYFPMFFGGRRGAQGPETPGVATAIANSFSQGRGAVATSHATAYGGPHMLGGNGSRKAAYRRASLSA